MNTLLTEAGFPSILTFENRFQAMTSLCLHSVFLSRKAELDQFMARLGPVLNLIRKNPQLAKPIPVADKVKPPSAEEFLVEDKDVDNMHIDFFKQYICTECKSMFHFQKKI